MTLNPARWLGLWVLAALLGSCALPEPLLDQIKRRGELVVVTRNSPTTYYEGAQGFEGFEYDLVRLFAERLGVKAKFIVLPRYTDFFPIIQRGDAHFAAAGLVISRNRSTRVRFSAPFQHITTQLVYHHDEGARPPKDLNQAAGTGTLEVLEGSFHEEQLQQLREQNPTLTWSSRANLSAEELLYLVSQGVVDYALMDSNEVALSRRFYPELDVAFDVGEPQPMGWAFRHSQDDTLFNAAQGFIAEIERDGTLKQLIERYYGYVDRFRLVDHKTFQVDVARRLPKYHEHFIQAATETGLDWRLIAALGYQESHWDPAAVSPTGVKGLMMLTQETARRLGVKDRTSPAETIPAAARYIRMLEANLPERIQEPDRLWLALAAYNTGEGHLEDARVLTQRLGGDPDRWVDVKRHLPLLSQERYHQTLRHGYARGREPVTFVDNIRSYHDMLAWTATQQEPQRTVTLPPSFATDEAKPGVL